MRRLFCPPAGFWDAATRHAAATSDHTALARAAHDRGRYRHAFDLYRAAAADHIFALGILAQMRERAGDHEGAEQLARAAAGHTTAMRDLARRREQESAERLYRTAADVGHPSALHDLARTRERAGGSGRGTDLLRFRLEADGRIAGPW
ncbi:hypothetical protein AB0M44_44820 [Streptosporangium subroseum]|uniref:hypothetical protein n=1 Tax=Streptosporangium subroseum TaxID=106412 RepID=UPI00341AF9A6